MFFTPQDNIKYRSAAFSFSLSARRRKGGTALHTHPIAGKFLSRHTRGFKLSPPKRWIDFLRIPYQAMLVSPTSLLGIELYSYPNIFFCSGWKTCSMITWVKTLYWCSISLSEVNYDTCLVLARFHLLVNSHFPSPFWEKNEFNKITLIFKMTKDAISFLGHRNTTRNKTPSHDWTG